MDMSRARSLFVAGLCALSLAGCAGLPRSAPTEKELIGSAIEEDAPIAIYPISLETVSRIESWPRLGPHYDWRVERGGAPGRLIAAGDIVSITIFDSNPTSLIAAEGQRAVSLGDLQLSPRGVVFLPYVGEVRIAGMSVDRARTALQNRLEPVVPGAQVQLNVAPGREQEVDLVAGVAAPGPYPLRDRGTTVLSAIAFGGGPSGALQNPLVRLIRGSHDYAISLDRLTSRPDLDTLVRAGDKLLLEEDDRTFTVIGAAANESVIPFATPRLNLIEALALASGVDSARANPEGVVLLREYPASAVKPGGPERSKVVFTADLTNAADLFAAKSFWMMPGDVLIPTESPVNGFTAVARLIGTTLGLVTTTTRVAN
ncbi:polysaccharide biosynthesis/export family protein [Jannaschia sp. Os4]|uniref:polysaccharide biosynthesis/export family protein n=1 Tax=Jannaschia sp. Os4 TaxID=2807617 RepID=UPI00193A6A4D|nr:polysaccharide biosynthesis/export family protein [Jannaschia sp. Os4]MBM2574703.1 polysaccharide biosynthesis/export family protein [Jannaschia sp. Os4]